MSKKSIAIDEMRWDLSLEQKGLCAACGKTLDVMQSEISHKIPQRKYLLKMYGPEVIHHRMNVCLTHHGACNDKVSIGNRPVDMDALAEAIRKERAK